EKKNDGPRLNINESPVTPTKISTGGILTTAQIAAKLRPSNVGIVVYTTHSNASAGEGSGIIMGEDASGEYTYIITCAHVISDAGVSVRIQTEDGTTYDAEIAGFDTRTDLCVLKIKAKGLPAAEFGNSSALVVGDPVYAIGNPGGVELFGSFTSGYVSSIDRPVNSEIGYTMKSIQHSAAISPGNSGGMLVNAYGQVIGINSQKIAATDYEGIGFAIPISSAKDIIENLINHGYVPDRPMLGITYYPVSASAQYSMIAQIKGLPAGTLIINEIDPEGALANTEARQYDMITEVDGKPLTTADVLLERIDNGKVGDKMILTLCRVNSNYSIDEFEIEIALVEDKGGSEPITTTQAYYIDPFEYFNQFGF
ncbi:MAG: trypsin-like peptidase domain-containing protein, partial [Clostridia bacterium]|nr:trypsin-like peptidase domain-containing protein [Clostridia bacterium]